MSRPVRVFVPGLVYELTAPCLNGERRLLPEQRIQSLLAVLIGALSRAPGIRLHAFAVLPSKVRLLASCTDRRAIPAAMQDFKATAAKRINAIQRRRGPVWDGPYLANLVTQEPHAQLARLRHVLLGAADERSPVPATSEYFNAASFLTGEARPNWQNLKLEPLPVLVSVPAELREAATRKLLRADCQAGGAVAEAWAELQPAAGVLGDGFEGVRAAASDPEVDDEVRSLLDQALSSLQVDPSGERPAHQPLPPGHSSLRIHAGSRAHRAAWSRILHGIWDAYHPVAMTFLQGDALARFPPWTLMAPAWRVGWHPFVRPDVGVATGGHPGQGGLAFAV